MRSPAGSGLILLLAVFISFATSPGQHIIWLEKSLGTPGLNRAHIDGSGLSTLPLPSGSLPEALAMGPAGDFYWSELEFSDASLSHTDAGLSTVTSVQSGGSALRGLALDLERSQVYWLSSNLLNGPRLYRSQLNGGAIETLAVFGSGTNPRGLALDSARGMLYWCDFDLGSIQRWDITAGSPAGTLLDSLQGPCGIAFDPVHDIVYWTEMIGNRIGRLHPDSGISSTVLQDLHRPVQLALDESRTHLVWGELDPPAIRTAHVSGVGLRTLPLPVSVPSGIAVSGIVTSALPSPGSAPHRFALEQNYPNPFNPSTTIRFSILSEGSRHPARQAEGMAQWVRLSVYDLLGREVAVILNAPRISGEYEVQFDAAQLPSGVYLYRLQAGEEAITRAMVLLR